MKSKPHSASWEAALLPMVSVPHSQLLLDVVKEITDGKCFHKFTGVKMSDTSMEKGHLCPYSFYRQTRYLSTLLILISVL